MLVAVFLVLLSHKTAKLQGLKVGDAVLSEVNEQQTISSEGKT